MKQTSSIGIMDFIRPHKGGFLCSVVLSVLGVASGIVPYFAVAKMINLLRQRCPWCRAAGPADRPWNAG